MTDKEKFINLFNEIGIDYKNFELSLDIGNISLSEYYTGKYRYGESVSLIFDYDGNFRCFEGYGE